MIGKWRNLALAVLCAVACPPLALAQGAPPTILQIELENVVRYTQDTSDVSQFATNPNFTTAAVPKNFGEFVNIGDIVTVNGQPAKGTLVVRGRTLNLRPTTTPGQAIADINRNEVVDFNFEILNADGTPVGTIMAHGLAGGTPPPGVPLAITQGNNTIVSGTGAYLGARGVLGQSVTSQTVAVRVTSMSEDPANRRKGAGGKLRFMLQVIPLTRPEIIAATHANNFSLVTAANPARAGEVITLWATGLGPTRPGVDPGQPFPATPPSLVNSPVEVSVNGVPAEVLYAGGYPGSTNGYQINLRLPAGLTPGSASLQVSVAWIAGAELRIAVQ